MAEPTENKLLAGLAAQFERYRAELQEVVVFVQAVSHAGYYLATGQVQQLLMLRLAASFFADRRRSSKSNPTRSSSGLVAIT